MTAMDSASYEVGYGKPPRQTQFQKGRSANPGGRPRKLPAERLKALALHEAYRTMIVMEDGHAVPLSAIQAVLRSQFKTAAAGNVRAQHAILTMIQDIEQDNAIAAQTAAKYGPVNGDEVDDVDDDGRSDDAYDGVEDDAEDADDAGGIDGPAQQQAGEIDTDEGRQDGQQEEREPSWSGGVSPPSAPAGQAPCGKDAARPTAAGRRRSNSPPLANAAAPLAEPPPPIERWRLPPLPEPPPPPIIPWRERPRRPGWTSGA
jgi:hypothetical protein